LARRKVVDDGNTILLVEDNDDDVTLTLLAFKKHRLLNDVRVVRDGVEALDWLFARGAYEHRDPTLLPRLVLLDLRLPKVNGFEVLRAIRANPTTAALPVVILTSSREDEDTVRELGLRATGFTPKPLDVPRFADAMQRVGIHCVLLGQDAPNQARRSNAA
jgi:two-component system response regulator